MGALLIGSILGSVISLILWPVVGWTVRPLLAAEPPVHRALVYLTIAAFVLIDLFAFAAVGRLGQEVVGALFAFSTGLQTTAALAAIIFIRGLGRR